MEKLHNSEHSEAERLEVVPIAQRPDYLADTEVWHGLPLDTGFDKSPEKLEVIKVEELDQDLID